MTFIPSSTQTKISDPQKKKLFDSLNANRKKADIDALSASSNNLAAAVSILDSELDEVKSDVVQLESDIQKKENIIAPGTITQYWRGDKTWQELPTSLPPSDGDKGDITVSSSGMSWTIDPLAVTDSKINDIDASKVTQSISYRFVTDTEKTTWNGKVDGNITVTGATKTKITYDAKGLVTGGSDASLAELTDDSTHRVVTDAQILAWNALIGGSVFQTVWDANTNTPSLTSGVGTKGFYYIININGTTTLDGISDWKIGDWAIFDGTVWRKVDNTDAVSSVNGNTGAVNLDTSNVPDTLDKRYVTDAQLVVLGNTSSTNTGDETTLSIQTKRPLKTVNGNSLEGAGNIVISSGGVEQYQVRRILRR